jgi:hypothetical protein
MFFLSLMLRKAKLFYCLSMDKVHHVTIKQFRFKVKINTYKYTMYEIGTLGWIAIAVVIIIVLVWMTRYAYNHGYLPEGVFKDTYESMIASAYRSYDKYIESPANLWTRAVGYENDETVQLAIQKATKLEEMHHANSNNLKTSAADAVNNAFILAELNRYNVAPNADPEQQLAALDLADTMYRRTVNRISNNPITVARNDDHTEAILERINEYARTVDDITFQPQINIARNNIRAARVQITKDKSKYYAPKPIRNDPQNVHDTELTHDIRVKFNLIIDKNNTDLQEIGSNNYNQPTIKDIQVELNRSNLAEIERENATKILNIMAQRSSISSLNTTEDKVILEIWKRINSPDNLVNRDELKNSLWQSLASGMEKNYRDEYTSVCTTGRCSRAIDSLTLMDNDTELAKPLQTVETLRNEILSKSYIILQDALKTSPIAAVYNGTDPETDENRQALNEFKESVKQKIADTINQDYPAAKPDTLANIIKDAQSGVDI